MSLIALQFSLQFSCLHRRDKPNLISNLSETGFQAQVHNSIEVEFQPEEKAGNYVTGTQRGVSSLDQRAVAAQGQTRAADPDDDITDYAAKFHLKKKAEGEKKKESFVNQEAPLKQQPGQGQSAR